MKRSVTTAAILGAAVFVSGCATYYQVKEPAGGQTYYTTDIEETRQGAVKFKDGKSGATITLQNSEIREIDDDEYEKGISQPAAPQK
ncbi:hypothetical protein ANRL1_04001 [Anaerolineae bacterium]|nr:hypothetical protein ANRL1_04001 [Anaerolineae bacterium]